MHTEEWVEGEWWQRGGRRQVCGEKFAKLFDFSHAAKYECLSLSLSLCVCLPVCLCIRSVDFSSLSPPSLLLFLLTRVPFQLSLRICVLNFVFKRPIGPGSHYAILTTNYSTCQCVRVCVCACVFVCVSVCVSVSASNWQWVSFSALS